MFANWVNWLGNTPCWVCECFLTGLTWVVVFPLFPACWFDPDVPFVDEFPLPVVEDDPEPDDDGGGNEGILPFVALFPVL